MFRSYDPEKVGKSLRIAPVNEGLLERPQGKIGIGEQAQKKKTEHLAKGLRLEDALPLLAQEVIGKSREQ